MSSARNGDSRSELWRALGSALVLGALLAPWLLSVVLFEAFLEFAIDATRNSGSTGLRQILAHDLHLQARQGAAAAWLSCALLVANSTWRRQRGESADLRLTASTVAAFYAAVMTHRAFLLADGIPAPDSVREAFAVRVALLLVSAIVIVASMGFRRGRVLASRAEGAVEIVACLVGLATLHPLLAHGALMEGWFAHEPPFCARGIEPLELPPTADRTASRHGVWRDGGYDPYPDPTAPPWAFALRGDEVAPSGSREYLPIGDPRIWSDDWRERRLEFPEIAVVADRRLGARDLADFLRTLYSEDEYTLRLTVHGPIEGSLSCDEMDHLRWALPWVASLGMVQGKAEIHFDRIERERDDYYLHARIGHDTVELRRRGASEPVLQTTRAELHRIHRELPDVSDGVVEFDGETTAVDAIEIALELRDEGFYPVLVAADHPGER